jgi:multidrug efflux pump
MRHIEGGMQPFEAALLGSREIGFTVVSMSISLVAVFIPILLMSGLIGRLFHEFAMTIASAILISMVVSLTTTPMLCAHFLQPHSARHGALYRVSEGGFQMMNRGYRKALAWVLRHKITVGIIWLATAFICVFLYIIVPKGFFPQQDTGRIVGIVMGDQDIAFDSMDKKVNQFTAIVLQDPAVQNVITWVGGGGPPNQARIFCTLKPLRERKVSADQVINRLRPKLSHIPGATAYFQAVQDLQIGGRLANAQFQYTLSGDNLGELYDWAPKLVNKFRTMPMLKDVSSDQQVRGLAQNVIIDRDTAARLGITAQQIDQILYDAFGQRQISTIYRTLNQYRVVLEVDPKYQLTPDALQSVYVITRAGAQVPLSSFAHFGPSTTSLAVAHQGQFPAVTLSFNLAPGAALGEATKAILDAQTEMRMPGTIHGTFQGTAAAFRDSLSSQPLLILAALLAVYIVLGILYESFVHPITSLSGLPSAGLGALKFFTFRDGQRLATPLLAVVLLIGIVDIVFAVDSIPAIFAITTDPFIVLTSNVFAILGLRAMYFLLAGMHERFHLLSYGLAIVLVFIGAKMLLIDVYKIPVAVSLAFTVAVLAATMLLSLKIPARPGHGGGAYPFPPKKPKAPD